MRLGKLYESYSTPDTDFIKLYQQTDLTECQTLLETKSILNHIFLEADSFAINNKLEFKYFQLAKYPLWESLNIEKQHFIYKGFDAWIEIDMTEKIENIKPYIIVQNNNVSNLQEGQRIEIDDEFIKSLNKLQLEIFEESLKKIETETNEKMKKVWILEQQRLDKWLKTTKINLQGTK